MSGPPDEVLAVTLARMETKLDNALHNQADHERRIRTLEQLAATLGDIPPKVRALEARQWPLPSAAVLLSVAAVIIPFVR